MYPIRPFQENDRDAVRAMGVSIIYDWAQHTSLHLVAGDPVVGHAQAWDRRADPKRRPGPIEMRLTVAAGYRRQGIGSRLYERVLAFAEELQAGSIRASYVESGPDEPARFFLTERGFTELRRDYTSRLDVGACDLSPFEGLEERLTAEGIGFLTYADVPDTDANRRRLFALVQEVRSQPVCALDPEPSEPEPFEASWVARLRSERCSTVQLAEIDGRWVGYTSSGVSWGITGVVPDCRRRGIATALKVRAIRSAKDRGVQILETENRADNIGMMTINRRLGYQFAAPVIECIKRLC